MTQGAAEAGQAAGELFDPTTREELPATCVVRLHLLRHGEVRSFGERVVRGQLDVALSAEGERQHTRLAEWLPANAPRPARLVTSDLVRCAELADRLERATGVAASVDARLREQDMGAWQGRTWAEVNREDAARVHAYWDEYVDVAPPGGESLRALSARVVAWWEETRAEVRDGHVWVAAHIGPIRALLCHLLGVPLDQALRFAPAVGSHTSVLVSEAGAVLNALGERPWTFGGSTERVGSARRIALSGSAGTGKTTLGRRLADELGVAFIEEGMRERLAAGLDVHGLDAEGWQRLIRELWEEQRAREEACADGFVADRSSIDYAAFWLHYGQFDPRDTCEAFLAEMFAESRRYERILLFPWGALPIAEDGVRSTHRWVQFRFQALLEGLLEREVEAARVLRVPAAGVEERIEHALARLR